jgi:hypothetical protein
VGTEKKLEDFHSPVVNSRKKCPLNRKNHQIFEITKLEKKKKKKQLDALFF